MNGQKVSTLYSGIRYLGCLSTLCLNAQHYFVPVPRHQCSRTKCEYRDTLLGGNVTENRVSLESERCTSANKLACFAHSRYQRSQKAISVRIVWNTRMNQVKLFN